MKKVMLILIALILLLCACSAPAQPPVTVLEEPQKTPEIVATPEPTPMPEIKSITVTTADALITALSSTQYTNISISADNTPQGSQIEISDTTLTIRTGVTVTVEQGSTLKVHYGGKLVVEGTLITVAGDEKGGPGKVEISAGGAFDNKGSVTNTGEFVILYERWWGVQWIARGEVDSRDNPTKIDDLIDGTEVTGVKYAVSVGEWADLRIAANTTNFNADTTNLLKLPAKFDYIYTNDDSNIELEADTTISGRFFNDPGCKIIVPQGKTLTISGIVDNHGNIEVFGTMTVSSGGAFRGNAATGAGSYPKPTNNP